jgi:hypothetical protein
LSEVFGRTNEALPDVWLRLVAPSLPTDGWIGDLVSAAVATGAPLDVTAAPVLWGPALRREGLFLVAFGTHEPEHATDSDHACDLVSAHLVQVLSALGRPSLDLYFLTVRRAWEEHQTDGALRALESARADGLVRHVGLSVAGSPLAALGLWQFRDAFEAVYAPDAEAERVVRPLAESRRVGVLTPYGSPRLVPVSTPGEVRAACGVAV